MQESAIYQEILLEGEVRGEARGKTEERNQIAMNMLRSNVSEDLVAKFTGLTLKQVQKLQKLSAKKAQPPKSAKTKRSPKA
jgi:predicted transposase YdaD